ncbi:ABC transporter permease [Brachyspira hyodysenteriae]|uniref:ABC transporter permease n=1 Tax=Brachyspira hyodysenteriae TaxID=159 RepID=UPI00063DD9DF|nr:ABC transporter permease [Brachyspira hyodysenteriae]KLI18054.1 ABC transporter permease [Brachyspira hyodysenteriae]KLI38938.1 ABC transporter permease [Brachyspira hyodysenteriae]MCZ9961528.1 ABC transporter permease [Brachyspira hyodysenteriae]
MDFKKKLAGILEKEGFVNIFSSFLAIIIGLLLGLIILLISNVHDAFPAFMTILSGGFSGGSRGMGQVIYTATPLILTGLSVGFAFKNGLFNIGAPGQFIVGAYAAVLVAVKCTFLPPALHWFVALIVSFIAGGLWAYLPGFLKAHFNVNEVISSIMMNYIGMYLVNYLVTLTVYDMLKNQSQNIPTSSMIPTMGLNVIFRGSSANGGFFIAVIVVIIVYIILSKTTFGFELKACGLNKDASKYAGINEKRNIILSMVIAGALAGLGGGLLYLSGVGKHIEVVDILAEEGFMGIPIALLGLSHPIGILIAGLFIAHITVGGFYMQIYDFTPEIIEMIISSIIYFSAFALLFKSIVGFISKKLVKKEEKNANE